jgi:hypothetical protein
MYCFLRASYDTISCQLIIQNGYIWNRVIFVQFILFLSDSISVVNSGIAEIRHFSPR